jgi:hypothetical protein
VANKYVVGDANESGVAVAELTHAIQEDLDKLARLAEKSPQLRGDITRALKEIAFRARLNAFAMSLTDEVRRVFLKFAESHASIVQGAFADDANSVIAAMNAVEKLSDDEYVQADVLVVRGIEAADIRIRIAAISAARRKAASVRIVCALMRVLREFDLEDWTRRIGMGVLSELRPSPSGRMAKAISEALAVIGGDRVTQELIILLKRKGDRCAEKNAYISRVLVLRRAEAAVPDLVEVLGECSSEPGFRYTFRGRTADLAETDPVLWAIVRLTHQPMSAYGFETRVPFIFGVDAVVGFGTKEDRSSAMGKFDAWWKENKLGFVRTEIRGERGQ